jgi:hypothetical protein
MIGLKTGVSIASLAAVLALTNVAQVSTAYAGDVQPCYGVNACKGQSDCKAAGHDCKGQNSCKGQGFKKISAEECTAQHGSLTPLK